MPYCRQEEIVHVHYMTTSQHKNPCPWGHEIYIFGEPFLGHHYYTLSFSYLCLGVEIPKKFFKEIMYFYYKTYIASAEVSAQETLPQGLWTLQFW